MKFHTLVAGTREADWYRPLHLEFPSWSTQGSKFARFEYRRLRRFDGLTRSDARLLVLGRLVGLFDAMPVSAVFA